MLEQTAPDRYEFHDLLRAYAIDQARGQEGDESRADALRRVMDWYLYTADQAQAWIMPTYSRVPLGTPSDGARYLTFSNYDEAVDWSEREQFNFLPAMRASAEAGFEQHAWRLALVVWSAKPPSTVPGDWLLIGQIGLRAAQRADERHGEAELLRSLGFNYVKMNLMAESLECHGRALAIWRDLGDSQGEATAMNAVGMVHLRWRDLDAAESNLQQAQAIFQTLGLTHWVNVVLANLATVRYHAGRLPEALDDVRRALAYQRENRNTRDIGNLLQLRSGIQLDLGELREAMAAADEAYELALDLRSHVLEGYWLLALASSQQALGQLDDALVSYHRSAMLHRRLGNRSREAVAWQGAGAVYQRLERPDEAADFYRRAAAVHHDLGHAWDEAMALDGLAAALLGSDSDESRRHWREAVRLIAGYRDPRATETRTRILARLED